jgi:hypothetical protein
MKRPTKSRRGGGIIVRNRPIRRSQLISPFGVGAITDFRNDEALMCAGIDSWFQGEPPPELRISEERLQASLGCEYFVLPPEFADSVDGIKRRVPYVRFPGWHYCPRCYLMERTTPFGNQPFCQAEGCSKGKGRRTIPIRIVSACEHGHIEEFPFAKWIGCECGTQAKLYFKSGRSSASIQGTKIECDTCHKSNTLAAAFQPEAVANKGGICNGARPWLGDATGDGNCNRPLHTLLRGASNVYFPAVESAIYVPRGQREFDSRVQKLVDDPSKWAALTAQVVDGQIPEGALTLIAVMFKVDAAELLEAVCEKLNEKKKAKQVGGTQEALRREEFEALRKGSNRDGSDLLCEIVEGSQFNRLSEFIHCVGLVRKLRETRVMTGFTRINPPSGKADDLQAMQRSGKPAWLPAIVVRGEGIFLEFKADAFTITTPDISERVRLLTKSLEQQRAQRGQEPKPIDAGFLAIHALSHALIRELTFLCGYGSSALRERIYHGKDSHGKSMLGLLIYTASGDSEGTLGGLVSQGEPEKLEALFSSAMRRSSWCSNDPVCIESPARGPNLLNLAACHGCMLLPETSCEEGNRLLDRALLVGTPLNPQSGFFWKLLVE